MNLLFLLIIPILIGLAGLIFGKGDVTWKELLIQEAVVVVLISVTFLISANMKLQDTEIWSGTVTSKEKSIKDCSESYQCRCRTQCYGSGSNRSCSMVCDTCWRYWKITNWSAKSSNGETIYNSGSCYNDKPFEPKRYSQIVIGEPTAQEHSYKNYIKASGDTVLKRTGVTKEFKIPEYPRVYDHYRIKRLISVGSEAMMFSREDNEKLDKLNSTLGARKQINITLIVAEEPDQMYFEKLKEEWLGGKKNDFVVVVGVSGYPQILWANVMSWSDSEDAKVFTKNRILKLKEFNLDDILKIIEEEVEDKYKRKEMKDFEYLKERIEPSARMKTIMFVVGIILSIGLTILFKKKDIA